MDLDFFKAIEFKLTPALRARFIITEDPLSVDLELFEVYAEQTTDFIKQFVNCFDYTQKYLYSVWADVFNFQNIQTSNEKNNEGYSQITTNYNNALVFLKSEKAKGACAQNKLNINNVIKIGKMRGY